MLSRRMLLVSGGAAVLVAGAGLTLAAAHGPGLSKAVAPWSQAGGSFGDPRLDALAYAILAPNSHNRQPWFFHLTGEDHVDVYCDLERRLPQTDPFDRQITMSLGCMAELFAIAASAQGYSADIRPFPDGAPEGRLDDRRIAEITLRQTGRQTDPLFATILQRRSNKQPYDLSRPASDAQLAALAAVALPGFRVAGANEATRVSRLTEIARAGWIIEYETDRTRRESIDVMRIGNREIVDNPDGLELGGTMMGLMKMTGIVTRESLDTPGSTAYEQGISMYFEMIEATPSFIWIVSDDNSRARQLEAGRNWVRLNLAANAAGLSVHPLSQVLQEFPEMAEPYAAIHAELAAAAPETVQMLARIGYGPVSAPTPRWPLSAKLIDAAG